MVKADAKRNYYADLEVPPTADTEEIKKQFRKLARLYHPDRNPGKEVEYVPKFQAIQAAHEVLTDPAERATYDAARRRLATGPAGRGGRPAAPPRPGQAGPGPGPGRSPYEAYSDFPPPRMRTQQNRPPQRPTSYAGPPPTPPPRPTFNYVPPRTQPPNVPPRNPPSRPSHSRDDSDARRTAWEHIRHQQQHQAEPTWSDDDGLRRARAARDGAREVPSPYGGKPGLSRSNTTRAPRKPGFDPSSREAADWEPQARGTSSYGHAPPTAPSPPPAGPNQKQPGSTQRPRPEPMKPFARTEVEDVPFTEGTRVRTPYSSQGTGQKTYFDTGSLSRSTFLRAAGAAGAAASEDSTPQANAARHRSASPTGKTGGSTRNSRRSSHDPSRRKPRGLDLGYVSSDETSSSDLDSDTSTKPMTSAADARPRAKAKPGPFWAKRTDAAQSSGESAQTAPGTPVNGPTAMPKYDHLFFHSVTTAGSGQATPSHTHEPNEVPTKSPENTTLFARRASGAGSGWTAINAPSITVPSASIQTSTKHASSMYRNAESQDTATAHKRAAPDDSPKTNRQNAIRRHPFPQYSLNAKDLANDRSHSFSFSNVEANGTQAGRSSSMDNINTTFTASEWDGKFNGSQSAVPSSSSGKSPAAMAGAAAEMTTDGFKVPPPPSGPPPGSVGNPPTSAGSSTGGVPLSGGPGSVKFAPEEWVSTIRQQSFFLPGDTERPLSPSKTGGKKGKTVRGRKLSKSEGKAQKTSGAEDEESEPQTGNFGNAIPPDDVDPMDIDTEVPAASGKPASPGPAAKPPRLVHVPPQRPEWREGAASIPVANGTIPPGSMPSASVPPPPPPPPYPSTTPTSNTKQKRDASHPTTGLNLDSLRATTPLSGTTQNGLAGMRHDLAGTLPFESHPSTHATKSFVPRQLELPLPPKAPTPPQGPIVPHALWKDYLTAMALYQGHWYQFESKMLAHFIARHAASARFGTGDVGGAAKTQKVLRMLEAFGEPASDEELGFASYLRGMEEDVRVGKHWDVAKERHRGAVEALLAFKQRVLRGEVKILPPET